MGRNAPPAQAASSSFGSHFKKPWLLGPGYAEPDYGLLSMTNSGPTQNNSTGATFWSQFGNHGTVLDSNFTADTYKNLLNVPSGKGLVATVVGPTADAAETTTFEFTVDGGTAEEIAVPVISGSRAVFGVTQTNNSTAVSQYAIHDLHQFNAGKSVYTSGAILYIPQWHVMTHVASGVALLCFETSLLVRIKHSDDVTATGSQERQCGIIHRNGL